MIILYTNNYSPCDGGQKGLEVVATQTAELLGHVLRPVLRAGLMAVHADALEGTAVGTDAVDDGLGVALPVQAGAFH